MRAWILQYVPGNFGKGLSTLVCALGLWYVLGHLGTWLQTLGSGGELWYVVGNICKCLGALVRA